ncbi:MAG: tryptophan synthase subunit alpha [Nitrospirota bacterium]
MPSSRKKTRIAAAFARLRALDRKAFIPYIMAGDPSLELTRERVLLLERCGADIIELGVPFSDPLADGPTIQKAAARALAAGVSLQKVLAFVRDLRRVTEVPLVLMTYYNPVFTYGEERFVHDAVEAGVDGVIIPDLPPDEAQALIAAARSARLERPLDTIFLVAPTSTPARMQHIAKVSRGFVYYVSMTGITGARLELDRAFTEHVAALRRLTDAPLAVGFGVATPDDARIIREAADGVIVGSAIVKQFHEHPEDAERFIRELREAIS